MLHRRETNPAKSTLILERKWRDVYRLRSNYHILGLPENGKWPLHRFHGGSAGNAEEQVGNKAGWSKPDEPTPYPRLLALNTSSTN